MMRIFRGIPQIGHRSLLKEGPLFSVSRERELFYDSSLDIGLDYNTPGIKLEQQTSNLSNQFSSILTPKTRPHWQLIVFRCFRWIDLFNGSPFFYYYCSVHSPGEGCGQWANCLVELLDEELCALAPWDVTFKAARFP